MQVNEGMVICHHLSSLDPTVKNSLANTMISIGTLYCMKAMEIGKTKTWRTIAKPSGNGKLKCCSSVNSYLFREKQLSSHHPRSFGN